MMGDVESKKFTKSWNQGLDFVQKGGLEACRYWTEINIQYINGR
jgi:hypothetical protein